MDKEFFMNGGIPSEIQYDHPFTSTWQSQDYLLTTPPSNDHFESALSSMVSSPAASNSAISTDNFMIRELIGKLGNICNANDLPNYVNESNYSTNHSCYSTPLNSPPKLGVLGNSFGLGSNLPAMPGDPGFADRAARFSSFGSRSFNGRSATTATTTMTNQIGLSNLGGENGKLQRNFSSPSLKVDVGSHVVNDDNDDDNDNDNSVNEQGRFCKSRENSSNSVQNQAAENGSNNRKRKAAVSKGKAAISTLAEKGENINKKGSKSEETEENKGGDDKQKVNEAPKDYIHVRARRGQATDSHSLAERVRREKISERMKLLQDLVPGCNRVTGKALMLDEIINYVQSLQRQVEFLSMKLSTVNPRLELNMNNILTKDRIQPNCSLTHPMYPTMVPTLNDQPHLNPLHDSLTTFGSTSSSPLDPLNPSFHHNQLSSIDGFSNCLSQLPSLCEGELQSVIHPRFGQNENGFESQIFHGTNPAQMKIEY
ncbi:hypothetical protein RND81_05G227700 [Saponaria officinalis]|uniref:BHLH domain-containing protein n=1 Tax=Saponaria officinalis TaxID=3572 RepID=A0AAW1L376_SAPOF